MNHALAALVNGGLLSALITASFWVMLRMIPRRLLNAATRYALWWAALAITISVPAIYLPRPDFAAPVRRAVPLGPAFTPPSNPDLPIRIIRQAAIEPPVNIRVEPQHAVFPIEITGAQWPTWVFAAWMLSSVILLIRVQTSYILLARASKRAADAPRRLHARVARWMTLCGSSRRARLAGSSEIDAPIAVGPRCPSILIPAGMIDTLAESELDQIGLHEAAHLARNDDYALIVQRVVEALFALHPVIRWITRQIDLEREVACDDLVIGATGRARDYATCLTRVAELSCGRRPALAAAPAADNRSHLARRIDLLFDRTRHTGTRLLKARLTAMIAVAAVVTWLAGRTPGIVAFATPLAKRVASAAPRSLHLPVLIPQAAVPSPSGAPDFEGRVVEDSSGDPLASAEVRFHKVGMRELAADLDTDSRGRIQASGLAPGDYTVDVVKPNYVTASLKVRVPTAGIFVRLVRYGILSGQVTDQQGRPVPGRISGPYGRATGGARITVLMKSEGAGGFTSVRERDLEDEGRFRIYDLPPGQYVVGLWYDGLKEGSGVNLYPDNVHPRIFTIAGGEEFRDLNFQILPRPVFHVSGKVQLPKPKTTFALALGLPDQPLLPIAQTLTADDGSFAFEKIPVGSYDLFVAGPDAGYGAHVSALGPEPFYGRTRVNVSGSNINNLDLAVAPGRSLTVKLGAHGADQPPAGCPQSVTVFIELLEPWGVFAAGGAQVGFGKEETLRNLAPGRFRLNARGLGATCYVADAPIIDLSANPAGPVVIELAPAGSIHGVLRPGTAHASDFNVVLLESDATPTAQAHLASPDPDGRFTFEGLRPGAYRIAALAVSAESKARWVVDPSRMTEIQVPGGAPTTLELPVPPAGGQK